MTTTAGVATRQRYRPFGVQRGAANVLASERGFVGQVEDTGVGLSYLNARHYDARNGTFLGVDPILDPGDPLSLNAYIYGANNPTTLSDPSGLEPGANGEEKSCARMKTCGTMPDGRARYAPTIPPPNTAPTVPPNTAPTVPPTTFGPVVPESLLNFDQIRLTNLLSKENPTEWKEVFAGKAGSFTVSQAEPGFELGFVAYADRASCPKFTGFLCHRTIQISVTDVNSGKLIDSYGSTSVNPDGLGIHVLSAGTFRIEGSNGPTVGEVILDILSASPGRGPSVGPLTPPKEGPRSSPSPADGLSSRLTVFNLIVFRRATK